MKKTILLFILLLTFISCKALEEKNDGLFDYKGKDETPTYSK